MKNSWMSAVRLLLLSRLVFLSSMSLMSMIDASFCSAVTAG